MYVSIYIYIYTHTVAEQLGTAWSLQNFWLGDSAGRRASLCILFTFNTIVIISSIIICFDNSIYYYVFVIICNNKPH